MEMETKFRLVIYQNKFIYDDLLVSSLCVTEYEKKCSDCHPETCTKSCSNLSKKMFVFSPTHLNNHQIHSYAVSAYVDALKHSSFYRYSAMTPLMYHSEHKAPAELIPVVLVKLREPKKHFLDYKWGERTALMAIERCEVDHAMSWLSTLGGAFSALGEHFQHCAQMAGKISIHQFKLALRLGDPLLEARCKLYAALSVIQQGNLKIPMLMIQDIFKFAVKEKDAHLQRMCQGVWAKLKYCYKLRRQQKKKLKFNI